MSGKNIIVNYQSSYAGDGVHIYRLNYGAFHEFISVCAGEFEDREAARAGANVIKNRMAAKGISWESDHLFDKLGGKGQFDAIGDDIYNNLMGLSFEKALASPYGDRVRGAIAGILSPIDTSCGAYWWNATAQRDNPKAYGGTIGGNWDKYNKGIFVITNQTKETTFFARSQDPKINPEGKVFP
jgi:hypothetical protein